MQCVLKLLNDFNAFISISVYISPLFLNSTLAESNGVLYLSWIWCIDSRGGWPQMKHFEEWYILVMTAEVNGTSAYWFLPFSCWHSQWLESEMKRKDCNHSTQRYKKLPKKMIFSVDFSAFFWSHWHRQFSSVTQSCLTLCDPMNRSTPGLPVRHQLPEFTQTHVHWVGDAIQPSPLLSSPSPSALNRFQHQSLFKSVSSSHQVAKVLEFQLQHQYFQWIFRTDFL